MRNIGFIIDSTFGVTSEFIKENNISVVNLSINIDGKHFSSDEVNNDIIVEAINKRKKVQSSQPSLSAFEEAFEEQISYGYNEIIVLTLASKLSGTYASAVSATKETNHLAKIVIKDTQSAACGSKHIFELAFQEAQSGKSLAELSSYLDDVVLDGSIILTLDNLNSLVAGGRLSKMQAFFGTILRFKPILSFKQNVLAVEKKVRSIDAVVNYLKEQVIAKLKNGLTTVRLTFVDLTSPIEKVTAMLKEQGLKVINDGLLNPVISVHIGAGGLGLYITNKNLKTLK